ncbi:hypothetical protein L218DRAFT_955533 [Marasmius fiardii PR-910]|nr:hypothetical protein L218DRAFT_955533 [Marasmius fiardii PR-910]
MIILKQEGADKERDAASERMRLRRGQSSRSYMEAPPPSYEAVELSPDRSFRFVRPSPSHSPSFFEAQVPNLLSTPRVLAQSRSHSNLRPYPNHPSVHPNHISPANASTPTLTLRSLDNPLTSSGPLASTSSNLPSIQIPTFTPSAKKSLFSTQSGNKKRTAKEARLFVLSQVTHLLQNQTKPQYTVDAHKTILKSCADACSTHELDLPALLQEKSVEEHTPFYWSIAQRPSSTSLKMPDLLQALLVFGHPLTEDTRMDVRRACLMVNDPKLYQALRTNKYYVGSETAQDALSPAPVFKDRVIIEDKGGGTSGTTGKFTATLEIPRYNERATIQIEFIAQRRLWRLTIRKTSNSMKWKIGIGLLEQSPATYLDSRFILQSLDAPPASRTRTYSDAPETMFVSTAATGSNSSFSSSGSAVSSPSYGYGVPSGFVGTAYSASYSPESLEIAHHQQQRLSRQESTFMVSSRTNLKLGSNTNASSSQSGVVKGAKGASLRHKPEIFLSAPNDSVRQPLTGIIRDGEDDEFSVSARELPPLSGDPVLKEVRLKSNFMISAGKKEIESEIDVDIDLNEESGKFMRARFEARLARPESECVIC